MEQIGLEEALPMLGKTGIFESIIERLGEDVQPDDRVRMVFNSPVLNLPITLPFMRRDELTAERIFERVQAVLLGLTIPQQFTSST